MTVVCHHPLTSQSGRCEEACSPTSFIDPTGRCTSTNNGPTCAGTAPPAPGRVATTLLQYGIGGQWEQNAGGNKRPLPPGTETESTPSVAVLDGAGTFLVAQRKGDGSAEAFAYASGADNPVLPFALPADRNNVRLLVRPAVAHNAGATAQAIDRLPRARRGEQGLSSLVQNLGSRSAIATASSSVVAFTGYRGGGRGVARQRSRAAGFMAIDACAARDGKGISCLAY
jgi:hypothetical protein